MKFGKQRINIQRMHLVMNSNIIENIKKKHTKTKTLRLFF